jgi:hypothetical protein
MKVCLIVVLALLGPQFVFAQDAKPTVESVKHLFEVMHAKRLIDDTLGSMDSAVRGTLDQALGGQVVNAEQQKIRNDMQTKLISMMKAQLNWSSLEPMMLESYRSNYTQKDVDALTRFYSSPTGQSIADKMPRVNQQTSQLMQARIRELMPEIIELEKDTARRMKEAASPASASPAPAAQPSPQPTSPHGA